MAPPRRAGSRALHPASPTRRANESRPSRRRPIATNATTNRTLALIAAATSRGLILELDASQTRNSGPRDISGGSGLTFDGPASRTHDNVASWDLSENAKVARLSATGGELESRYSPAGASPRGTDDWYPWSNCVDGNPRTFCHTYHDWNPWVQINFDRAIVDRVEVRRPATACPARK